LVGCFKLNNLDSLHDVNVAGSKKYSDLLNYDGRTFVLFTGGPACSELLVTKEL